MPAAEKSFRSAGEPKKPTAVPLPQLEKSLPSMMTHPSSRADDGSVLRTAMAAVMLILAGLALMAWDDHASARAPHATAQHP